MPQTNRNTFGSILFNHILEIVLTLISDDHLLQVPSEIHGTLNLTDNSSKFYADVTFEIETFD